MSFQAVPGTQIAGYTVEREIGRGGMATVYAARHASLARRVALKILARDLTDDPEFRRRFQQEARLAASIEHPNVVPVYETGEFEGLLWIAMRYIDGDDLKRRLERGRLDPDATISVLVQVASALDAAHRKGLVHRDVKPGNILLERRAPADDFESAYLTDFGLARPTLPTSIHTQVGVVFGTVDYMAPEQIEGAVLDGRSDVYALGCVLYECLAGSAPFHRETVVATMSGHIHDEPIAVSALRPELPPELDEIFGRALAKDKADRYGTTLEFMQAVSRTFERSIESSALAAGPRARPQEADQRPAEIRKIVTMLIEGVAGLTGSGAELDPEVLRRVIDRYFEAMRVHIERHGGTIVNLTGDAVMAAFGIPSVHEDDALRAVRAAGDMRTALRELNKELERDYGVTIATRIGINTGEVVAGGAHAGEGLLIGDVVNTAARLEQTAGVGEILFGDQTHRLVRDAVVAEPVEATGRNERVTAWRLLEVHEGAEGIARHKDAPLVGRASELRLLADALDRAMREQACILVTILGAAGVGKSRLVDELLDMPVGGATVLRGRCLPYGEGITFWPIIEMLTWAAGLSEVDGSDEALAKIRGLLEGTSDLDVVAERLAHVLGLTGAKAAPEETFWAVRRAFEAIAARGPLVVDLDDLHWAEPTLLDLVEHVADWSRDAPILLLCSARPELLDERPGWSGGKMNATTFLLEPLPQDQTQRLATALLAGAAASPTLVARIAATSEGNPLFVEQMVGMLRDDGLLEAGELETDIAVPPTIQALLGARLDRLASDERAVIERASIEGKVFHRGGVLELCDVDLRDAADLHLRSLMRRDLIRAEPSMFAGEDAYRFRHQLIRDAAYASLPKGTRAELHARFADWLERAAGERVVEWEEILGYHLEQAHHYLAELGSLGDHGRSLGERAGERFAAAGHRTLARGDSTATISLLSRAAALLPAGRDRAEALLGLGSALWPAMDFARGDEVLGEAVEAARQLGDPALEWRAVIEKAFLASQVERGSWSDLEPIAQEAIGALEEIADDRGLARAWRLMAMVHRFAGATTEEMESFERAADHARRASDRGQEIDSLVQLMVTGTWGPVPASQGIERCREIQKQAQDDRAVQGAAHECVGVYLAMLGNFEEGRAELARGRRLIEELGLKLIVANDAVFFKGFVDLLAGNPRAAEREVREAYRVLEEVGERAVLPSAAGVLAEAVYAQGRFDEAESLTHTAERIAASEDVDAQMRWRSVRAKVLARRGEASTAGVLAREAVSLAARTEFLNQHGDALIDLAEVLRLAGRLDEAASEVRGAIALYERKENLVAARKARELLQALASDPAETSES